jgi:hypothetical protein
MPAYSPPAITALYPLLEKAFSSAERSGVYANKAGYHNSRNVLRRTSRWRLDYSTLLPVDLLGDGDASSAIDVKLNREHMRIVTTRLMNASKAKDPRLQGKIREWFGSYDGDGVDGYSLFRGRLATSDASHEWHIHISGYRRYANDRKVWLGIAEVMLGLRPGTLSNPAVAEPVPVKPTPARVTVDLTAVQAGFRAGGAGEPSEAVKAVQKALGVTADGYAGEKTRRAMALFQVRISDDPKPAPWPDKGWDSGDGKTDSQGDADGIPGRQSLTALGFTVQAPEPAPAKPAPKPTTSPEKPMPLTKIRVATFNVLSDAAGRAGREGSFASRLDRIITAIKASRATVLLLQECNADRAADIQGRLGADWVWSRAGSRVVMVNQTLWAMGDQRVRTLPTPHSKTDKTWPLVQLTHRKAGDIIWAASVHLSSTSPYLKVATTDQMAQERKLQAEALVEQLKDYRWVVGGGDHNSASLTAGRPKAVLQAAGFQLLTRDVDFDSADVDSFPNTTPGGQQIDDIWCKSGLTITDGQIIPAAGGSDHHLMVAELTVSRRN